MNRDLGGVRYIMLEWEVLQMRQITAMIHVRRAMDLGTASISSLILGNLKAKMRMDIASGF